MDDGKFMIYILKVIFIATSPRRVFKTSSSHVQEISNWQAEVTIATS